jgi:penicillin-binding protein 1A
MSWILEGTITSGTGRSANIGRPAAGKTGSAQNNADATFVGYTPERATAVWVGFPESTAFYMTPPLTPITVYGGTYPARIWKGVMEAALADIPPSDFPAPPSTTTTTSTTVLGEAAAVPNVEGKTAEEATAELKAANFSVKTVNVESDEFPAGIVVNQAPQGATMAPQGSQVTLEVAIAPNRTATVPNVVGLAVGVAESQLTTGGFSVVRVFQPAPPGTSVAANTVWRQTPAAGGARPADGMVQLFIQP